MKKLENKTAFITGGNSGIGLAVAQLFASEGATLAITGRNQSTLDTAAAGIGNGTLAIASDVTNLGSIAAAFSEAAQKLGPIDVLVVNAGVAVAAPLADLTEAQFDTISDTNFKGAFFTVQQALPFMNDGASIILTSSATNDKGFPQYAAYAASKAAIRSLARGFSQELMERGIRVNVVSPGAVDTPFFGREGATDEQIAGAQSYMASTMIPAKRLGTAAEVAEAYLYLASDASKYIMGAELVIDGGVKTL